MNRKLLPEIWRQYRRTSIDWHGLTNNLKAPCCINNHVKRHLITVGIGSTYGMSAQRLVRQAKNTGWFDVIHVVDGRMDTLGSISLLKDLKLLMHQHPRGGGLWAWKPTLLRRAMVEAPAGAHIYYIDAGCELSTLGNERFKQLDAMLEENSALLFHTPFLEDDWTKPSLLDRFPAARGSTQIQATWLGLRKDTTGELLVQRWEEVCNEKAFTWLKDPPTYQLHPAKEHRHDQSVLSCVIKSEFPQIATIPWEDFFAPWLYHKDSEILLAPVHALRNRNGSSVLDPLIMKSNLENCLNTTLSKLLRRKILFTYHKIRDKLVEIKLLIKSLIDRCLLLIRIDLLVR